MNVDLNTRLIHWRIFGCGPMNSGNSAADPGEHDVDTGIRGVTDGDTGDRVHIRPQALDPAWTMRESTKRGGSEGIMTTNESQTTARMP